CSPRLWGPQEGTGQFQYWFSVGFRLSREVASPATPARGNPAVDLTCRSSDCWRAIPATCRCHHYLQRHSAIDCPHGLINDACYLLKLSGFFRILQDAATAFVP